MIEREADVCVIRQAYIYVCIYIFFIFQIYLEYVVKNPFCSREEAVKSELFKTKLDEYVRGLPIFATKLS